MKDTRIGRFKIGRYTIDERPEVARALLNDMIVLRAEMLGYYDGVEYQAINPAFGALEAGAYPSEYIAQVTFGGDGTIRTIKWQKTP